MTIQEIITLSLRGIGVIGRGDIPSPDESTDALNIFNSYLKMLSEKKQFESFTVQENFPMVISQGSYTIGTGGNFNTSRPNRITNAYYRLNGIDYQIEIIGREEYLEIEDKTISEKPTRLWYEQTYPLGKIYLYPVPNSTDSIYITSQKPISTFALSDTLTLPGAFEEALRLGLEIRLCRFYEIAPRPDLLAFAKEAEMALIKREPPIARFDSALLGGERFNIFTG